MHFFFRTENSAKQLWLKNKIFPWNVHYNFLFTVVWLFFFIRWQFSCIVCAAFCAPAIEIWVFHRNVCCRGRQLCAWLHLQEDPNRNLWALRMSRPNRKQIEFIQKCFQMKIAFDSIRIWSTLKQNKITQRNQLMSFDTYNNFFFITTTIRFTSVYSLLMWS